MSENIRARASHTGAWGELVVATDLLKRGYDVFRNACWTGPVDLIVMKDDRLWKVQVKVRAVGSTADYENCDVLALVRSETEIDYIGENFALGKARRQCKAIVNTQGYPARCKRNVVAAEDDYCSNHRHRALASYAAKEFNRRRENCTINVVTSAPNVPSVS